MQWLHHALRCRNAKAEKQNEKLFRNMAQRAFSPLSYDLRRGFDDRVEDALNCPPSPRMGLKVKLK